MSAGDPEYTKSLAGSITYKGVLLSEVLGMQQRITLLEQQNARLRAALQLAQSWVGSSRAGLHSPLYAEIQALLAEPQPAATQQPKGGGE